MVLHKKAPIDYHAMASKTKSKALLSSRHSLSTTLISTRTNDFEPICFSEATKHPQWRATMVEEITAVLRNGTWTLAPRHPQMNVVSCKWVFHIKRKVDGTLDLHKARLVAKGFNQEERINYIGHSAQF